MHTSGGSMHGQVSVQCALSVEGPLADDTLERLVPCVDHHVILEAAFGGEHGATHSTGDPAQPALSAIGGEWGQRLQPTTGLLKPPGHRRHLSVKQETLLSFLLCRNILSSQFSRFRICF